MTLLRTHQTGLRISWLLLFVFIPLLSYSGRSLQNLLDQVITADTLGVMLVLLMLAFVFFAGHWLYQRAPSKLWLTQIWFIPLFVIIPMMLPITIERMHFVVFGVFGFVSLLLWSRAPGLVICGLIAGMDEVFQWWLPDRVGDLRDVFINMIAVYGGALLALTGRKTG